MTGNASDPSPSSPSEPDLLPVRMLNEFTYCPRLFHLMHVEGRWQDNAYTLAALRKHHHPLSPS